MKASLKIRQFKIFSITYQSEGKKRPLSHRIDFAFSFFIKHGGTQNVISARDNTGPTTSPSLGGILLESFRRLMTTCSYNIHHGEN